MALYSAFLPWGRWYGRALARLLFIRPTRWLGLSGPAAPCIRQGGRAGRRLSSRCPAGGVGGVVPGESDDGPRARAAPRCTEAGRPWALRGDGVDRADQVEADGRSAEPVAGDLQVAPSTVRRTLKEAGVALRPGRRQWRDDSTLSSPLNITEHRLDLGPATGQRVPISFPGRRR